jgi:hypothetical protein
MQTTAEELEAFYRFALARIGNGQAKLSLAELVDLWELEHPPARVQREVDEALDRAQSELEAGAGRPADAFNAELRAQYGFADR